MELKVCAKCKVTKTVDNFHICKRNGYRSRCKDCKRSDDKLWRENNKDLDRISKKKWRDDNKEYMRIYYLSNKGKIDAYIREYYLNNREDIKNSRKEYYYKNRELSINNSSEYYESVKNSELFIKKRREYMRNRYSKYPYIFAHRNILKRHLLLICEKKINRTEEMLGYSSEDLKLHIESLFRDGMSWSNYGEWHIDHIKPISKFDKNESTKIVNSLDNLQPLWAYENLKKGDRYEQS